ncbi:MAG: TetR/AcrR family transcriptional regulator [Roseburia sp.]|nr:TetR/AcrR family transcriptional regulator [Roseburia sp.]MCM1098763.1 TetR/AcrR family transcriptional regulator [Ruminococcus flavefaciens]
MANFTKKAIKDTFIRMLDEKPLSRITVKDIVEECGVNRNSFYYHFQDIPALLDEIVTEDADQIIAEYQTIDSAETCLTAALEFARKNRRAILHIYQSVNRDIFEQHLWKVCEHVVSAYSDVMFAGKPVKDTDREVILHYYKGVCFGIVMEWMNTGMKDGISDRVRRLCELRRGMVEEMVERSLR